MWGPWVPILACLNDFEVWRFEDKLVRAYNDAATQAPPVVADPNALNGTAIAVAAVGAIVLILGVWGFVATLRKENVAGRVSLMVLGAVCVVFSVVVMSAGGFVIPRLHGTPSPPTKLVPLPHNLGPRQDGLSLRFSLIRDTLHERYDRHGSAYYEARVALAEEVVGDLAALTEPTDEQLAAMDDLSVALDHLERVDEAIAVQQRKLELAGESYTTYANLGTHLVHRYIGEMMAGDADARVQVEAGLAHLRQAVELNPDAHFGREEWQIHMIEGLLRAARHPESLTRGTLLGQPLAAGEAEAKVALTRSSFGVTRHDYYTALQEALVSGAELDTIEREMLRADTVPKGTYMNRPLGEEKVPWDEPILGLIGMWQVGGGPNPHSALCMATGLEEVGEVKLAWAAYERARLMADRFAKSPEIVAALRAHCESCQAAIAKVLGQSSETLRREFDEELKLGMDWQAAMADYEAEELASGADLRDPAFYDMFYMTHGAITTGTGGYDQVQVTRKRRNKKTDDWQDAVMFIYALGISLFVASLIITFRDRSDNNEPA